METYIVPTTNKNSSALKIMEDFSSSNYYFFLGDHYAEEADGISNISDSVNEIQLLTYKSMIHGKKIANTDVSLLVNKNEYASNTIYDMYEHDVDLSEKTFFVSVDEGSYTHIYKCLDNNFKAYSTAQPTFAHVSGANTNIYRTSDGYVWKYLYSYDSATKLKFSTTKYIPVVVNTSVQDSATPGKIDIIKIDSVGRKYDNYISGSFGVSDIKIGGNSVVYKIDNAARNSNSFYTGCLLYLNNGTGAGQYKIINNYFSNNSGKYIVVNSAFSTSPTNGTEYQIYPSVLVTGTGRETANVVARALINASSSNSVYRIEILDKGAGFTYTANAAVVANSVVGVQDEASLKVILPPAGGHGSNQSNELYAKHLSITSKFTTNESNTITIDNGFKQIGIIKNPLFANVQLNVVNAIGVFSTEKVYKISPAKIAVSGQMNTTSNLITASLDEYYNNITSGDYLYLTTNTASQLAKVSAVNSSAIQLAVNGFFTSSNAQIYFANKTSYGNCYFTNVNSVMLEKVYGFFANSDLIIGELSGAKAVVNTVSRSGETKNFNTFTNLNKLVGSLISGSFTENEQISSNNYSATLHSTTTVNSEFRIYVSNVSGDINTGNVIVGDTSTASATITTKYNPEIEFNSGEIIYLENISRIERSANTSESFNVIFEF